MTACVCPPSSTDPSPTVHHSILHHQSPPSGNPAYDTLSLESSDSMETSVSTGNSACTPERWETGECAAGPVSMGTLESAPSPRRGVTALFPWQHVLLLLWLVHRLLPCQPLQVFSVSWSFNTLYILTKKPLSSHRAAFSCCVFRHVCLLFHPERRCSRVLRSMSPSACGLETQRIEEMEKMLKEAQQEKARLMENRVSSQRGSMLTWMFLNNTIGHFMESNKRKWSCDNQYIARQYQDIFVSDTRTHTHTDCIATCPRVPSFQY